MRRIIALLLKICHNLYTYSLVGLVFSSSLTVRSMFRLWYNYRYNSTFYCLGNLFCYCGHDVAFVFYLAFFIFQDLGIILDLFLPRLFIVQWPEIWAGAMLFFGFYIASSFQSTVVRDLGMVLVLFCLILDWAG